MHQGLAFAVLNDHHQNGLVERSIRSLQDLARCQMIHSQHRWPYTIPSNLWPYEIQHAAEIINENPCRCINYTSTPIQFFSKSEVYSNPRHWQPLFCPVYVLSNPLSEDQPFDECKDKITQGIYLGMSPIHARTLDLVISLSTGMVSTKLHVGFDP